MERKLRKTHCVYALALEEDCFYVGVAPDVGSRFEKHLAGKGAEWTQAHRPIKIIKEIECESLAHALLTEDALALWLMGVHGRGRVRGGRWMNPGHEHIYGLEETRWVQKNEQLSAEEKAEIVRQIVKWTIPENWYWQEFLQKYPKMKKSRHLKGLGKSPEWVKSERQRRNALNK